YANNLFVKQRSKEIGLYQLIGMSKMTVVRMITIENFLLWGSAIALGATIGFLLSRFFAMILFKIINVEALAVISFSSEAFVQTIIVFACLFIIVTLQAMWKVKRSSLLALFQDGTKQETHIKQINTWQMLVGALGIVFIAYGYYLSTVLFDVKSVNALVTRMVIVLGSTIFGTYLVFRYSIAFIFNALRKIKRGHLSLYDVLANAPIMHRMKSNAKSLTLITVLTGLTLGILSLTYISYYSIDESAALSSPFDLQTVNDQYPELEKQLAKKNIEFEKYPVDIVSATADFTNAFEVENVNIPNTSKINTHIIAESAAKIIYPDMDVKNGELNILGYTEAYDVMAPISSGKEIKLKVDGQKESYTINKLYERGILSSRITFGAFTLVLSDGEWARIAKDQKLKAASKWHRQTGYNLVDAKRLDEATEIYYDVTNGGKAIIDPKSKQGTRIVQTKADVKKDMEGALGLSIFITGFLGLAFLLATGSILYFKQMSEAEDEKASYKTMRKIGFTKAEIMRGIYVKQLFNFGAPLLIGLLHSYFAVKSGWTFFGSEMTTPLFITMGVYTLLYIIFALLSVGYYRKVVNASL
ncbi:MAG: ABC transporter permease, partial [Kurthia sp.]